MITKQFDTYSTCVSFDKVMHDRTVREQHTGQNQIFLGMVYHLVGVLQYDGLAGKAAI